MCLVAKPSEVAYLLGVSSSIQTQFNNKQANRLCMTLGDIQTLTSNITAAVDTFLFLGAKPSEVTYLAGASSNIQTQLNNKQASGLCIRWEAFRR